VLKTAPVLIQINTADLVASWRTLLDQLGIDQQSQVRGSVDEPLQSVRNGNLAPVDASLLPGHHSAARAELQVDAGVDDVGGQTVSRVTSAILLTVMDRSK
jgi:hypothetical protein